MFLCSYRNWNGFFGFISEGAAGEVAECRFRRTWRQSLGKRFQATYGVLMYTYIAYNLIYIYIYTYLITYIQLDTSIYIYIYIDYKISSGNWLHSYWSHDHRNSGFFINSRVMFHGYVKLPEGAWVPSGKRLQKTMERFTIFFEKTHVISTGPWLQ